ncbi:MAG: LPS export ABC transporter permease LptG [Paracoccaceae bacterium]
MTLSLYFARRFASLFAQVFGAFFGLMLTIEIIDELRRFSDPGITVSEATVLALMSVPASLYRILPLILILSAIGLFVSLARSSELVVVRAAGRSGLRFLLAPVVTAILIGGFAVAVLNPIVAATSREYDTLSSGHARGGSVLSISDAGLWLRQGGDNGQTVIQAERANLDGTELYGVTFQTFSADGVPISRTEAATARLGPGAWALSEVKQWPLDAANPEKSALTMTEARIVTDLTAAKIRDGFGTPSAIGFWDLPGYIAELERAGFSARSHRVWFQMELAQPLLFAAMVLIAAGFTMRHSRLGKTGSLVMMALLAGFIAFFLRNFGQVLGNNGQIPILIAAWTPPVAAALSALGLLLHLEDG